MPFLLEIGIPINPYHLRTEAVLKYSGKLNNNVPSISVRYIAALPTIEIPHHLDWLQLRLLKDKYRKNLIQKRINLKFH